MTYSKSTGPELAGKIQAGQRAGKVQYNLVVAGYGEIATGAQQGLWQRLLPNFESKLGDVESAYEPGAKKMYDLIDGYALASYYNPNGPLLEYNPAKVDAPAEDAGRAARVGEGEPEEVHLRAARELRPGPDIAHGSAVHPRRRGPARPRQGLGQDVGVPQAARQAHRPLPVGHGRDDGRADVRRGQHDRQHDRLGRQPARARRRAEELQDRDVRRLHVRRRRALHGDPARRAGGRAGGDPRADEVTCSRPRRRPTPTTRATSTPARRSRTCRCRSRPPRARRSSRSSRGRSTTKLFAEVPVETQLDVDDIVFMFDKWDREVGGSKVTE